MSQQLLTAIQSDRAAAGVSGVTLSLSAIFKWFPTNITLISACLAAFLSLVLIINQIIKGVQSYKIRKIDRDIRRQQLRAMQNDCPGRRRTDYNPQKNLEGPE